MLQDLFDSRPLVWIWVNHGYYKVFYVISHMCLPPLLALVWAIDILSECLAQKLYRQLTEWPYIDAESVRFPSLHFRRHAWSILESMHDLYLLLQARRILRPTQPFYWVATRLGVTDAHADRIEADVPVDDPLLEMHLVYDSSETSDCHAWELSTDAAIREDFADDIP